MQAEIMELSENPCFQVAIDTWSPMVWRQGPQKYLGP